jgi:hypothetical protein
MQDEAVYSELITELHLADDGVRALVPHDPAARRIYEIRRVRDDALHAAFQKGAPERVNLGRRRGSAMPLQRVARKYLHGLDAQRRGAPDRAMQAAGRRYVSA